MRWYMPSFSGDFRLEPVDGHADRSTLVLLSPTLGELEQLKKFFKVARKKSWIDFEFTPRLESSYRDTAMSRIDLRASVAKAGAELVKVVRPKDSTITALNFEGGRLKVVTGTGETAAAEIAKAADDGAKAAASVQRPTPSCPQCVEGAIGPASEVLQEFMTDEQHADWAEHRALIAVGGYSGHRYLIAHRKSATAAKIGRICFDLDSRCVIHFHDSLLPPEEEVLSAKLILEHREDWLRNEATLLGFATSGGAVTAVLGLDHGQRYKNPFGDILDGVPDAHFTQQIGGFVQGIAAGFGITERS